MPDYVHPHALDPGDFDAVGVVTSFVVALRGHAILADVDAVATVNAPAGWHPVTVTARASGHVVLGVRYWHLSSSRWHNVAAALEQRGWRADENHEGATRTYPPGSEPTDAAFETLAALTVAGAPAAIRIVTAIDGRGTPVPIGPADD
jgi:hypothetical protein